MRIRLLFLCLIACIVCFHLNAQTSQPLSASLDVFRGRPTIFINREPVYPMIYALTDVPGGRWSWEELPHHNILEFCNHGIRLYQIHLFFEQMWKEDGTLDISPARRQIRGILDACPDAAILMRLQVTAPRWWLRAHPGEWVRYADAGYQDDSEIGFPRIIEDDNFPVRRVSMASAAWRQEAGEILRRFLTELAATPEGNALVAVQPANGIYGEWHNWGFYRNEPDTSTAMTLEFRSWLARTYETELALRKAWHLPSASFAAATVPDMHERQTTAGIFRNPAVEQKTIDYYTCVHQLVADNILYFARVVKRTWPRPILTGSFYGYFFSVFGRQAAGGHLEVQRLLSSPDIDYLAGPQAYEPEALKLGDPFRSRSLITSVLLHGKLWLDENDNEPTIPIDRDPRHDLLLRNAIANVRRNSVSSYTRGAGLWYYDFGVAGVDLDGFRYSQRGAWGNWDHPAVQQEIQEMHDAFQKRLKTDFASDADVLFVCDTKSFYHTASLVGTDPVSNAAIDRVYLALLRSGVACDPIHLDDLERVNLSRYRVVVFGNTFVLSAQQRRFIKEKVATNARTLIWFYAPGYSDAKILDTTHISDLTGMHIAQTACNGPPRITVVLPDDSSRSFSLGERTIAPLFCVDDPTVREFGYYEGSGKAAVARKSTPACTSWYLALPPTIIEPLKNILRSTDAHMYVSAGEIVYAGGGILAIHTTNEGEHKVTLRNGKALTFQIAKGASTLILDAETGESVLK